MSAGISSEAWTLSMSCWSSRRSIGTPATPAARAWRRVRPWVWASWESLERRLPELGEPFFFTAEAPRDLWSVRYPERVVLVFGRESAGLPLGMRKRYQDRLLAIPMLDPKLRSLNLSSAVAVVLYEVLRQREAAGTDAATAERSNWR